MMGRLTRYELMAVAGGVLLGASQFAPWYRSVSRLADIAGFHGTGAHSSWQVQVVLSTVLLVVSLAPFVLAYVVARDHELSWAPGELTAVLAIVAVGLVLYVGVVDRPGDPPGEIELGWGWYVALLGSVLMVAGAGLRTGETERARTPPGTI